MPDFRGELSPAPASPPVEGQIRRIVLTGYMGRGKSAMGLLLADRTGRDFLNLDAYTETMTNKTAQELFDALGETGFRQLETGFLGLWVEAVSGDHRARWSGDR